MGDKLIIQTTIPQGAQEGPPLAMSYAIVLALDKLKHLLLPLGHQRVPTLTPPDRWNTAPPALRVARLLVGCVSQLMDDLAVLVPYHPHHPHTWDDVRGVLSEIHHRHPVITGVPTFTAPLDLKVMTDGP